MRHEDERGVIEDLKVGKDWSVTYISFKKGAVRGNHYHNETKQMDVVVSGRLVVSDGECEWVLKAGEMTSFEPGIPHAYVALEDSEIVSMCKGKRIGENYESDTLKLETPLL